MLLPNKTQYFNSLAGDCTRNERDLTLDLDGHRYLQNFETCSSVIPVLKTLQEKYVFRNDWIEILKFLNKYPLLASVLVEAHHNLMQYFPNNSQVFLSIDVDPEDQRIDRLVASVASGLDVDVALDALSAFDDEWWIDALKWTQGKLCITLE